MRILIWGTGQLSWNTAKEISEKDIIGYIDTYATQKDFAGKPLYMPKDVNGLEYDAILVSTIYGEEILKTCNEMNIPLSKVIFAYGNIKLADINSDYDFVTRICGEQFAKCIKNRYHLIREIEVDLGMQKKEFDISDYSQERFYNNDYVRLKTFELLADEIKQADIKGEIAELGVFRGEFAKFLNLAFPDRTLYLFDTFEGFEENELKKEVKQDQVAVVREIYKNTSIQIVMNKMAHKDNVVIKQGFFPDSLEGLEEKFAFVSIDCDWEESIYQGLKYFYPRLTQGGYIMLHDYNNFITCAKKAIKRYENDMGVHLCKLPICDTQGSLVLTK